MFEEELDVTPEAVQPETEVEADDEGATADADAQPQEPAEPAQSAEQNAFFAENRRKQELEATRAVLAQEKADRERLARENERLMSALNDSGFQGNALDIADRIEADRRQVTPEQVKYERLERERRLEADRKRYKDTDPEYQRLRQTEAQLSQIAAESIRRDDLAAIKAHNPKETVKDVGALGGMFGALRLQGVSAVDAYEAVRAVNSRKQPPKSMGGLQSQGEQQPENKYATMSDEDFLKEITRAERGELLKG